MSFSVALCIIQSGSAYVTLCDFVNYSASKNTGNTVGASTCLSVVTQAWHEATPATWRMQEVAPVLQDPLLLGGEAWVAAIKSVSQCNTTVNLPSSANRMAARVLLLVSVVEVACVCLGVDLTC